MTGFSNAIVGGMETLIRSAIRSANYVANVAGWRIAKDGSAELNTATIRGSLSAGGGNVLVNSTGVHVIGANARTDINTAAGFVHEQIPNTGQRVLVQSSALFLNPPDPSPINNDAVDEGFVYGYYDTVGSEETPILWLAAPNFTGKAECQTVMYAQSALSSIDNSRIVHGSRVDATKNIQANHALTANVTNIAAETVILLTAAIDWLANTAYRVKLKGRWQPANGTTPRIVMRIKKTGVGGQTLIDFGRLTCISAEPYNVTLEGYFRIGAADILNTSVVFTIASGSGAGVNNVGVLGSAGSPFFFEIEYVGNSSQYLDYTAMV